MHRPAPLVRWSLWLDVIFVLLLILFFMLVRTGERGGAGFFSNPRLAIPIVLAAGAAVAGGVVGLVALFRPRERSLVVLFPIIIGFLVLAFVVGEWVGHD